ncbi:MAG: signal peptidase I [Corynebacteriales bacterium]|nr:signal peptidase I [Mycobacteriales bacterium]
MPETDQSPTPERGESSSPNGEDPHNKPTPASAGDVGATQADGGVRPVSGVSDPAATQQAGHPVSAERAVTEKTAADKAKKEAAKRKRSFWLELPILVLVAVIVAVVVRTFFLQTFYIPSSSMEKTLLPNDRVLVNKVIYDFRDPHRGEVVVFEPPKTWDVPDGKDDYIKRVIGVGGDHIVCCDDDGRITINGKALKETYLYPGNKPSNQRFDVTVPKGRLFVMGDHRAGSSDSRFHMNADQGTISVDSVVGRAFSVFWPLDRAKMLSVPDEFNDIPDPK